jgi:hypothetical protein
MVPSVSNRGWRPESGVKGTGVVPVHGDVRAMVLTF